MLSLSLTKCVLNVSRFRLRMHRQADSRDGTNPSKLLGGGGGGGGGGGDNLFNCEMYHTIITFDWYIQLFTIANYGIPITDILMPKMDNLRICHTVHRSRKYKKGYD